MKSFISILVISLFFGIYYSCISFFLIDKGYINFEHLFISDKLFLLLSGEANTLEVFYFTYPVLAQVFTLPAALIDPISAPVVTSTAVVAIFAGYLIVRIYELDFKLLSCLTTVYFLCSPIMIFLAVSGSSLYLNLLLYFLFFHFVFKYTRDFTTYNFVIISICLTAFVFLDYSFLWVIIFMIPLILFFSIYNTIGIKKSYIGVFTQITQKKSQRRKLLRRSFSTFIVISFIPLASFLFYLIINYWFTGQWFYFDRIPALKWNYNQFTDYTFFETSMMAVENSFTIPYVLKSALLLSPIFIVVLYLGRRRLLFQYTMVFVPLWLIFYKNYDGGQFLSLHVFLIITAAGIAGMVHLLYTSLSKLYLSHKAMPVFLITVFTLFMVGEYFYFKTTNNAAERDLFELVHHNEQNEAMGSFKDMATYIDLNLNSKDIILADNSIFYPTIALTRDKVNYLDQFKNGFYNALQEPELFTDYILISNVDSFFRDKDKLTGLGKSKDFQTVYANDLFVLKRIKK